MYLQDIRCLMDLYRRRGRCKHFHICDKLKDGCCRVNLFSYRHSFSLSNCAHTPYSTLYLWTVFSWPSRRFSRLSRRAQRV